MEQAAILLARDLRAVQNQAVIVGRNIELEFLPDGDGYKAIDELGDEVILYYDGIPLARRYNADGVFQGVRYGVFWESSDSVSKHVQGIFHEIF